MNLQHIHQILENLPITISTPFDAFPFLSIFFFPLLKLLLFVFFNLRTHVTLSSAPSFSGRTDAPYLRFLDCSVFNSLPDSTLERNKLLTCIVCRPYSSLCISSVQNDSCSSANNPTVRTEAVGPFSTRARLDTFTILRNLCFVILRTVSPFLNCFNYFFVSKHLDYFLLLCSVIYSTKFPVN